MKKILKITFKPDYIISAALALGLSGCAHVPPNFYSAPSGATVWNFTDPADTFAASTGTAKLGYRDPGNTGWGPKGTVFAKAGALKLPLINGLDAPVMAFPAAEPSQGYSVTHNSPPNGVYAREGYVSNYTMVMDLLLKDGGKKYRKSLYQASAGNNNDAEMFVENKPGGGLGAKWNHGGTVSTGTWHRLAWAVQCSVESGGTGQISKFIDGLFAGGQYTPGDGALCGWSLEPVFHLFTDDDGETGPGFLASLLYTDRMLTMQELAALGGPSGRGADVPGPRAPAPAALAGRRIQVIGHRANTGNNPENTLAGIRQAFDLGADLVEVDVRLSASGVPVLMHDEDVRRTTNGSGPVTEKTLGELKALDAGSWFDRRYAGEKIPTLAEALREAKGRGKLFLDVKGLDMGRYIKMALKEAGVGQDAVWLSQGSSLDAAANYRKHVPGAPVVWEGTPPAAPTAELFDSLKQKGFAGFDIDYALVTKEFIDAAHSAGMFVSVYTVLDTANMLRMIKLGVDAMETDYPAELNALLPPR
ncbi:MAG: glycerophosphodiester phosphodiesterase family protein [Elusimicrobiota bacterium]|nr:glycerophosphodiester phosphodiesterase family protein [Elusimicrobiota bacterium]